MKADKILNKLFIIAVALTLFACQQKSPNINVIKIIDATEDKLFKAKSAKELVQMQHIMIENISTYLVNEHNGYSYTEGSEEYIEITTRLKNYNYKFICAIGQYNPVLKWEGGDMQKIAECQALMQVMEHRALTTPQESAKPL